MQSALAGFPKIRRRLRGASLLLLLDYDGTLTPIVSHPDKAQLTAVRRNALKKLSRSSFCAFFVISGRSRKDLREKLHGVPAHLVGDHGFDMDRVPKNITAFTKRRDHLIKEIKTILGTFPGTWIEKKTVTFSLHYRKCSGKKQDRLLKTLTAHIPQWKQRFPMRVTRGKKIMEFRPNVRWNKGTVVQNIIRAQGKGWIPIYIGDDITDEDAFRAICKERNGLAIRVGGRGATAAGFFLYNVAEVYKFLEKVRRMDA